MPFYPLRVAARIVFAALPMLAVAQAQDNHTGTKVQLTPEQRQELRALQAGSASKAPEELRVLMLAAKRFNANLLSPSPDAALDDKLGKELVNGFANLIQLRVERIRAAAKVLTPEQKAALAAALEKSDSPLLFDDLVRKVFGDQ